MRTVTNPFYCRKGTTYDENDYHDLDGNIVKNNPIEYPYSYDDYVIYRSPHYKKTDTIYYLGGGGGYSDKEINVLSQMGLKPLGASCETLSYEDPKQVARFISIIMQKTVTCTAIVKGCFGCGNPYYHVYYH